MIRILKLIAPAFIFCLFCSYGCSKKKDPLSKYNLSRMNGMHKWHVKANYTPLGYLASLHPYNNLTHDTTIYFEDTFSLSVVDNQVYNLSYERTDGDVVIFSGPSAQGSYSTSRLAYNYVTNAITIGKQEFMTKQLIGTVVYTTP